MALVPLVPLLNCAWAETAVAGQTPPAPATVTLAVLQQTLSLRQPAVLVVAVPPA